MSRTSMPAARRRWGEDDSGCVILHVDMDSFFASVEILDDPGLRGRPVVVAGGERGVVTSASYEARAFGVRAAMPTGQARRLCPQAVFLPGRHGRYREVSGQVMAIVRAVTDRVEQISIDEAFLDVSGALRRLGSPLAIARQLRGDVRAQVGVPASVGVAATKHVAKLATSYAKPDGVCLVSRDQTLEFLHQLPVEALWGVGGRTHQRLEELGVHTVGQLAQVPVEALSRWIGAAAAAQLHDLSWGIDPRPVEPRQREKSIGTETTFGTDVTDPEVLRRVLLRQSHECAARLRQSEQAGTRVTVKVRFADFTTLTRSRAVAPTQVGEEIYRVAAQLFARVRIPRGGVRLLGVRCEALISAHEGGVQATLDGSDSRFDAERAADAVRHRFGDAAVAPGSLVRREKP